MAKHNYPINPDIGLKVGKTFTVEFSAFDGNIWKFHVRSKSEANIAKGCLMYYKQMWDGRLCEPVTKKDVVVDIGAHVGFFAVPISYLVKKVIAFEPSPANYKLLEWNIDRNVTENVTAIHAAASDVSGPLTLNLGIQGTTGHSTTHRKKGGVHIEVAGYSFESIIKDFQPSVLKIDGEGVEWQVLTDQTAWLLDHVRIIIAELHKVEQHSLPTLLNTLQVAGFKYEVKGNSWFTKLVAFK